MILLGIITALVFVIKDAFVEKTILTIGLLVLYVGAYFVQSLLKDDLNFFLNVLTTASLLFIDLLFVNLLLFNIVYCGIYRYKRDKIISILTIILCTMLSNSIFPIVLRIKNIIFRAIIRMK